MAVFLARAQKEQQALLEGKQPPPRESEGMRGRVSDIQVVAAVEPSEGGLQLRFRNGSLASLPASHPDYDIFLIQIDWSREVGRPLGMVLDAVGRIADLNHTYDSLVGWLREDEDDSNRLSVALWAFSPATYLTRDHPDFLRLRATLTAAAASGGMVYFANYSQMVEGEEGSWHEIMDVRPMHDVVGAFAPLKT
jgi:hypothetical protein